MSNHSPEPWVSVGGTGITRRSIILRGHTGSCPEQHIAKDVSEADAHRIVACVNACEGISNEVLDRDAKARQMPLPDPPRSILQIAGEVVDKLAEEVARSGMSTMDFIKYSQADGAPPKLIAVGLGGEHITIEFTRPVTLEQHSKICCFSGGFELGHRKFMPGHKLKVTAIDDTTPPRPPKGRKPPKTRTLFLTGERENTTYPDKLVDVPADCFEKE